MSQQQTIHHDSYARDRVHREKLKRKADKISGLKALLEMWEETDPDYARELRARLHSAENQFTAMQT